MQRLYATFALLVALVISACASAPDWDPKAMLEHARALTHEGFGAVDLAQDDRFLVRDPPQDPGEALAFAEREIADTGREIVPLQIDRVVTFKNRVLVPLDFTSRPVDEQAVVLLHERCHAKWQDQLGYEGFAALYLTASWRWALEVVCYRQTVVADVHFGRDQLLGAVQKSTAAVFAPNNRLAQIEKKYRYITPPILGDVVLRSIRSQE